MLRFVGWVRIGFRRWIPATIPGSDPPTQVYAEHANAHTAEDTCRVLTRNWLAAQKKARTIDVERDGEVIALLAGTPPWLPHPAPESDP